jgi:hypothetical protein
MEDVLVGNGTATPALTQGSYASGLQAVAFDERKDYHTSLINASAAP